MAELPGGQKVGFAFFKCSDQGSEWSQECWRPWGERTRAGGVGRLNYEGEEYRRDERDDGKDDE